MNGLARIKKSVQRVKISGSISFKTHGINYPVKRHVIVSKRKWINFRKKLSSRNNFALILEFPAAGVKSMKLCNMQWNKYDRRPV